jgi:lecithin-cholesterol acyltransferase
LPVAFFQPRFQADALPRVLPRPRVVPALGVAVCQIAQRVEHFAADVLPGEQLPFLERLAPVEREALHEGAAIGGEGLFQPRQAHVFVTGAMPGYRFFPAYYTTRLDVRVHNQAVATECPVSGRFEVVIFADNPYAVFNQVCQDKLLTLVYDPDPRKPMARRFSEQKGVKVTIADYGKVESVPVFEDMYVAFETAGYRRNENLRVAGYDSRLTPDIGNFLSRTVDLIEETYRENGERPVHLLAHSYGTLFAQYVLTHTSQAWKAKYVQGYSVVGSALAGSGSSYMLLWTGQNHSAGGNPTDVINALSSARMHESHPSTYALSSSAALFGDQEVVIRSAATGTDYTPADYQQLFNDAGLTLAQQIGGYYLDFAATQAASLPNVDTYAETGSGIPTVVGVELPDLTQGQLLSDTTPYFYRDGDGMMEDISVNSISRWNAMPCYRFEWTDNPGLFHIFQLFDPGVTQRLLANAQRRPSECRKR